MTSSPRVGLITGVFGSGKSAVVSEIAGILEARAMRYGALDLDWLWWFDAGGGEGQAVRLLLQNLEAITGNYRAAGVDHLVMALAVENRDLLASIASVVRAPLQVVRLETPLEVIADRLTHDAETDRQADLRRAKKWIDRSTGVGLEDAVVSNDRPLRETADEIIAWLGWLD